MVQGLLFFLDFSNKNKSAHYSMHTFSSICICLCTKRRRRMLPRKTLHDSFMLGQVVKAAHQRAAAKQIPGSGRDCWHFRMSPRTSFTTGPVPFWGSTKGRDITGICRRESALRTLRRPNATGVLHQTHQPRPVLLP